MKLTLVTPHDAKALAAFYRRNEAHLQAWEPLRPQGYHTVSAWAERLEMREQEQRAGIGAHFVCYDTQGSQIIATCSLSNIIRGPFQACHLGYNLDSDYQGQGHMMPLCQQAIDYAFNTLNLHRIMANYMPNNSRSAALLQRLNFTIEGTAKDYLYINGRWEDHLLTSLINPKITAAIL